MSDVLYHLLVYDDEETDAEPLITAQYSVEWLPFLLAAVGTLKSHKLWEPDTDMEAVEQQVNDLQARLMGVDAVPPPLGGTLPIVIPGTALYFYAGRGPTRLFYVASHHLAQCQYTDIVDESANVTFWDVWLEPDVYIIEIVHSKSSNYGKFYLNCIGGNLTMPTIDCYSATLQTMQVATGEFEVTEERKVHFELNKLTKNPLSTGGYILIDSVTIRLKSGEE
jgi:hypothetical protein